MNLAAHHLVHRSVDHAVGFERLFAGKCRSANAHTVVASTTTGAGMADVQVAVVADVQFGGGEGLLEQRAYALNTITLGSTGLNGRTLTSAYTPAWR